jgi:hypothetical protein
MAFVKLDCGILNSTLWVEREPRDVFITALLMAQPIEIQEPMPQFEVRSLEPTGFMIPPGWYGFVQAAGPGIVRMSMSDQTAGMDALEKLGAPDPESRSSDFEGRRLVRVDGGYVILNFMKYRDKDNNSAIRSARYRERKAQLASVTASRRDDHSVTRDASRSVTKAEAEAEAEEKKRSKRAGLLTQSHLVAEGVSESAARDWLAVRKSAKAPLTETAWNAVKTEAAKANLTIAEAVKIAAERGWRSFKADWLKDKNGATSGNSEMQDLFRRSL